mgnify:CR=1 FL=1
MKETVRNFSVLLKKFGFLSKYSGIKINSIEDINKVPFTKRLELQNYNTGRSPEAPIIFYEATGGTGGDNFFLGINKVSHDFMVKRAVKAIRLMEVKKKKNCLNLLFSDLVAKGIIDYGAVLMWVGDVHNYKSLRLARDALRELSIEYVFACPNLLWDVLISLGKRHTVKKCMVSGELLLPWFRSYFRKTTGIELYNWYGSSGGFIAAQDDPDDEFMKILDDGLYLEVIDESGCGHQIGTGTLVYTDLFNYSSPLIRYVLEDKVTVIKRGRQRYLKLYHRDGEHLKLDGELVYKGYIAEELQKVLLHNKFFVAVSKLPNFQDSIIIFVPKADLRRCSAIEPLLLKHIGLKPKVKGINEDLIVKTIKQEGNIVDYRRLGQKLSGKYRH